MHRRLDPVTGLMVLDGESVPSQVRNSITADIAEVNNKIQVFYPLGAAGTVPTSTGSGSVTWEPKNQFGINISFDNGSFDYDIDASLQTANRTAVLPDRDGTFAFSANSFSGIDFGSISGNPSAVQNGQAWYDTAVNQFKFRQNAATIALSTMAGQDASNVAITGGSISGLSSLSAGTITASTSATVTANTASTSTTTGALVVTGGVGVGGAVFAGANSSFNGVTIGRGGSAQSNTIAIGGGLAGNSAGGAGSTYVGNAAGRTSTGANNTLIGSSAGESVASGTANSVLGATAYEGGSGSNNVIVGTGAARSIGAGDNNIIIGLNAGRFITGGSVTNTGSSGCVFIGRATYPSAISQSNVIVIGDQATGDGSNTTVIGTASTVSTRAAGSTTSTFIVSGNEVRVLNSSTPTENAAGSIGAQRWDSNYQYVCTAINTTGAGISNAGTGGTNGTYRGVQLTRVSGGTATAYPVVDIVISGGVVTSVTVVGGTAFSSAGNPIVMTSSVGNITNFQYTLETLTPTWKRIPLRSYSALIPISEGGTGASTTAGARANLGIEAVVTDATTARTLASANAASYIRFTSSSAITLTIPTNATDPIPIGSEYFIRRAGTGAISLSNAGVTVNNSDIANLATGRVCCLKKVDTNEWDYIP